MCLFVKVISIGGANGDDVVGSQVCVHCARGGAG